jgi:hypothetical protein
MKTLRLMLWMVLIVCVPVLADRTLSADEVRAILTSLTQQPVGTWLPAGSIRARHLEYSGNEKTVSEYREISHFDGLRFYREITLVPDENNTESDMQAGTQKEAVMDRERIFCWDGVTYTQYYKSAAAAVIQTMQNQAPFGTYGPFSAGSIPWGNGMYSFQTLSGCVCTAHEVLVENQKQIHMQVTDENASTRLLMSFVFDPDKNYAVLSHRIEDPQLSGIDRRYSQFVQVNNRWIPTVITTERFLKKPEGNQVVSYEDWKFETIKPDVPSEDLFKVKLKNETLVELHSSGGAKSLMYYVNEQKDIAALLQEKTVFSSQQDSIGKNCAVAAVQLVAKQFSRPYPAGQIGDIVAQNSKMTSLYLLRGKLEETGLYCTAVETNLESLRKITASQVVLHLEDNSHYVILDRIDDANVWTIDLTSRKVYWKTPIAQFLQQWTRGIALIVSENPQNPAIVGTPLSVSDQQQILGGDTTGTNYSCSELIQEEDYTPCPKATGLVCGGRYYTYWDRYGCAADPNGRGCTGEGMPGHSYATCDTVFGASISCIPDESDRRYRDIRACK